ncbi:MAG TPA: outer membrane protein assembly factor BamD [Bacteroidales bacterium]|nr:outer membrane protein assembly factor BamD [Bacteroidales bacterium]
MSIRVFIILIIALLASSCGEYEKLLKSTDYELKRTKALEFFDEGKYVRTSELLAQILPRFRGTDEAENMTWISANCYFNMRDYITASAAFRNFAETYPYNEHTEEATFMAAYCDYMMAPRPNLDQTFTNLAIEGFTYFQRLFPDSEKIEESQNLIDELEDKLVEKSYLSAKMYYEQKKYKAAIVALSNSLKKYPETRHREELLFLKLESAYLYAANSVSDKQQERYQDTLDEYYSFIEEFPDTGYSRDLERIYSDTALFLRLDDSVEMINK